MMNTQIYKNADLYIGRWLLVCTFTDDLSVVNTQYNIYFCRGTCFVEITPPEGGSVACLSADGSGISLSTWSEQNCRWSNGPRTHIAALMGVSWQFARWMPGLLLDPAGVPLSDSCMLTFKTEYDTTTAPADGKKCVGLVEDDILTATKYHIDGLAYVETKAVYQRLTHIDDKE